MDLIVGLVDSAGVEFCGVDNDNDSDYDSDYDNEELLLRTCSLRPGT